ncbi:unnamed protein product [Lactuca saligna]|uniref:Uncharacterized protein n=1 Tax=Lactuca saligna TaxID=75948 RepID=A0AA35UP37_LACSI|nr:unnamed protein product [Lactuca saligna]
MTSEPNLELTQRIMHIVANTEENTLEKSQLITMHTWKPIPAQIFIHDSQGWTVFPLFNRDLLIKDEVKSKDNEIHASDSITISLRKLFIDEPQESSSCSSSEADELEALPSGIFCVWRPKTESGSLPVMRVE